MFDPFQFFLSFCCCCFYSNSRCSIWLNSNWVTVWLRISFTHTQPTRGGYNRHGTRIRTHIQSLTFICAFVVHFNVIVVKKKIFFEPQIVQHDAYKHLNTFTISEVQYIMRVLLKGLCVAIATSFVEHDCDRTREKEKLSENEVIFSWKNENAIQMQW